MKSLNIEMFITLSSSVTLAISFGLIYEIEHVIVIIYEDVCGDVGGE